MYIEPTETQRENLRTLSKFLRENEDKIKDHFNMRTFLHIVDNTEALVHANIPFVPEHHPCGAVGCAIGYGVAAGIEVEADNPHEMRWSEYAVKAFAAGGVYTDGGFHSYDTGGAIWIGLFTGDWAFVDNTVKGAADRIDLYLDTGFLGTPNGFTMREANPT